MSSSHRRASLSALALLLPGLLLAPPAPARTWRLEPAGAGPERAAVRGWEPGGAEWLRAADHPLSPRLTASPTTRLELDLPGAGTLRLSALGVSSADTGRVLAPGQAVLRGLDEVSPGRALVEGAWAGADDLFQLRPDGVKHDLLLHEQAVRTLGGGELRAEWLVEGPPGIGLALEGAAGAVVRDANGGFVARLPSPLVADALDAHWRPGVARWELSGQAPAWTLALVVDRAWVDDPARTYPLHLDPTVTLQPLDAGRTGFVDENGAGMNGAIDSGSLGIIFDAVSGDFFGMDCRGFAEFDTSSIADTSRVRSVRLLVWLSNHGNPGRESIEDPVQPLSVEFRQALRPASATPLLLWAEIGALGSGGVVYHAEVVPETGPVWCPDSYVLRDVDLGPQAAADLESLLTDDFFTVGFVSEVGVDTGFDHIDYIGFDEVVNNPTNCTVTDLPGSRITLIVETSDPPTCDAGGPYEPDCPTDPILLDGTASSDPDGDPLVHAWTTDCPGTIADADQPLAVLQLDPVCAASCTVTLTVREEGADPSDPANSVSCTALVETRDDTTPVVGSSELEPVCLWPPRHDYFALGDPSQYVDVVDGCGTLTYRWMGCASDQPDEAREEGRPENGDGHFTDDCLVLDDGAEMLVRVERAGNDPEGRSYGLAVLVDDGCGHSVVVERLAHVPHDRSGGSGGQDDPCRRGSKEK